jgi:hypothetical protein|tara:strand:+ start:72 stop:470 length:399 start_codon:yes stop_codon:yes gene_type:complete
MNTEFWTSSTGKSIRWILFLPTALISAIIAGGIVFLINLIQGYFSGDSSQWAYVGAAVFSMLALIYVSWYIVPNFKKFILYTLYGLRVIFSIIWFIYHSSSPLSLVMLIIQELMVLGFGFYLISKLLSDEEI